LCFKRDKALIDNDYSFETIHNINEYGVETRESVKKVLHDWNMTVQFWMANYVYKRVPTKFQKTAG
jgi:lysophospholipid acyltransferase 7